MNIRKPKVFALNSIILLYIEPVVCFLICEIAICKLFKRIAACSFCSLELLLIDDQTFKAYGCCISRHNGSICTSTEIRLWCRHMHNAVLYYVRLTCAICFSCDCPAEYRRRGWFSTSMFIFRCRPVPSPMME